MSVREILSECRQVCLLRQMLCAFEHQVRLCESVSVAVVVVFKCCGSMVVSISAAVSVADHSKSTLCCKIGLLMRLRYEHDESSKAIHIAAMPTDKQ